MKNKAFTLAEIIIVLVVIGVIAGWVIPTISKGMYDAQYKMAYKKAYNTIVNLAAIERISGNLLARVSTKENANLFEALSTYSTVKAFADLSATDEEGGIDEYLSGIVQQPSDFKNCVKFLKSSGDERVVPSGISPDICAGSFAEVEKTPWVITEDNMAYTITSTMSEKCLTVDEIEQQSNFTQAAKASCAMILVDVNGLSKSPNMLEPQISDDFTIDTDMQQLTGDRYYIFIGRNGATAGPPYKALMGRILIEKRGK